MPLEKGRYGVKYVTFPTSGERLVLVEGPPDGIAVEATTIYTTLKQRAGGLSPNADQKEAARRQLSEVETLL